MSASAVSSMCVVVMSSPMGASARSSLTGLVGCEKAEATGNALQLHGPDLGERDRRVAGRLHDVLAHEHLAGSGVLLDPGRDVHRSAEVVTLLEDHRPGVDPD